MMDQGTGNTKVTNKKTPKKAQNAQEKRETTNQASTWKEYFLFKSNTKTVYKDREKKNRVDLSVRRPEMYQLLSN